MRFLEWLCTRFPSILDRLEADCEAGKWPWNQKGVHVATHPADPVGEADGDSNK